MGIERREKEKSRPITIQHNELYHDNPLLNTKVPAENFLWMTIIYGEAACTKSL